MDKYVFINGKKYKVVDNYILGLDVYADDSIPTPAVADSGKVLGVDEEGKYALTEAGGGGGGLIVTFTTNDNGNTYTCDKTVDEIYSAMQSKTPIYGYKVGSNGSTSPLTFDGARSGEFASASFTKIEVYISDSYMQVETFSVNASNVVTVTNGDFQLTAY